VIVDTDTHVTEPADLWTSRLPASWGDQVMHVAWNDEDRSEGWYIGDRMVKRAWTGAMFGWTEPFPSSPPTLDEAHPATHDLHARLRVMDEEDVRVAVLYPNIAGLAFDPFLDLPDRELGLAHIRAYNDFLVDWISDAPDRFVPLAVIPYWDVPAAVAEIERVAAAGHRGVVTTGAPQVHGQPYLGDRHWDPMWAACQDAGLPVSFHAANGDISAHIHPDRARVDGAEVTVARASTASFLDNAQQVLDLILGGVLVRFPILDFISVESGLGWVPFVMESADYHFKKQRVDKARPEFGDLLPSDLFRRQVYVNYWFERLEPWHLAAISADHILFETDFPHPTCLYGDEVRAAIANGLGDHPQEIQDKILWKNAARLFRLNLS